MKRLVSLILTVMMLLTMVVPALAAGTDHAGTPIAETAGVTTLYVKDAIGKPGAEFDVDICIENNPGIVTLIMKVEFPSEILELVDIIEGDFLNVTEKNLSTGKLILESDDASAPVSTDGVLFKAKFKVKDGTANGTACIVTPRFESASKRMP